jgi:hypothetical protein
MRRTAALVFFVSLLASLSVHPTFAQEGSATLTGFVADQSKAVIPGVKVTAIEINTNQRFQATTGKDGSYTISYLPVGPYQVQVEKPGFKTILKDDLFLHTQDALEINFEMAVGSTSESVTVSGGTSNDNPAVSMTVTREFIENMPLNGQSFQDLIQLAPGTVSDTDGYYVIDGQRSNTNIFTVDGVSANQGGINNQAGGTGSEGLSGDTPMQTALGTTQSLASVDSLQEFTIQTSGYTAEYGRSPGGQVQFTTRSGTNDLHGTLSEYFRNTIFDANTDVNDYYGDPKEPEHQNDFGGTVGGPLIIPHFYNGKDRTFYFLSYEGLRLLTPAFETEYLPTPAFRSAAAATVQPFLNAVPLPNGPENADGCTVTGTSGGPACDALFTQGYSNPSRLDSYSARLDHRFGSRVHAFLRYADTPSFERVGYEDVTDIGVDTHMWTGGLTASLRPNLVDDLRFSYGRDGEESGGSPRAVGGATPFPKSLLIPTQYEMIPTGAAEGLFLIPSSSLYFSTSYYLGNSISRQYQALDSIAWEKGVHDYKLGIDWRRLAAEVPDDAYSSLAIFASLASVQNGYASTLAASAFDYGSPILDNISLFAEDHWTLDKRITIDYGLRWEINPAPGPSNGFYPVGLNSDNLATAMLLPLGTEPYKTRLDKFAPRFGFAWNAIPAPRRALTVRGGFGIFFDTGQTMIAAAYTSGYPYESQLITNGPVPLPFSMALLTPPSYPSLGSTLVPPYPFVNQVSNPNATLPYTEQWNLSLDEALNARNTLTSSYVGNNGMKLLFSQYFTGAPYGNQAFANGINYTSNASQSSYNGLQVQDVGRIYQGLNIVGSFTYAHARDSASSDNSQEAPQWGNSNYDIRKQLNIALNCQSSPLRENAFLKAITGGWLLANRFSAQSGYPINIVETYETLPGGEEAEYFPNLVTGVPIYLHGAAANVGDAPVPGAWRLNPAAFAEIATDPTTGDQISQGTLGRNYIRTPPFWVLNTALQRDFSVHEQLHLKFRADAFNILNHPNLNGVDRNLSDSSFGELIGGGTTTIGASNELYAMGAARSLQFSLKLQF